MQQDYILKKIIAGYLGTDQGLFRLAENDEICSENQ